MHDDVIKWKHFPRYWPFVRGIHGEFAAQRLVTRSSDVFFDLRLTKRLSKQWWGLWFETPSRPLWRHCHVDRTKTIFAPQLLLTNVVATPCLNIYIIITRIYEQISHKSVLGGCAHIETLNAQDRIPVQHSQYHGCWCLGSFHHQGISTHDIEYVEKVNVCLTWGRISTICVVSMWSEKVI